MLFLGCCLALNACTTVEKSDQADRSIGWSSSDPLSIPFEIRQTQFKKGNIVINPSFEIGHRESGRFKIEGWQPVGDHVGWALSTSESNTTGEANSGRHAIKIVRTETVAKDDAAGIISDYLPVIPGNYDFTFYIRLKDIRRHSRPELKPDNALDIKALFFDKNKQPIDPQILFPVRNTLIDNSNKSYAFSRLEKVEDFSWSRVRGRSYQYPFSEGDIPDATRYVRLFLGLIGSGSMWIDDIDFRYSKWNFTTLERFRPYFTRQLTLEEKITPTPQHFQRLKDVVYFDARNPEAQPPIIVLPGAPAPAEQSAAALIQKEINNILRTIAPVPAPECHGNQHPSSVSELVYQRRRNGRGCGRHDGHIEGGVLPPADGAVSHHQRDVLEAHGIDGRTGSLGKLAHALHGIDPIGHERQERREVSAPCSDLQDLLGSCGSK